MGEAMKKTKGKQKIEMKPIENADTRMITFAKRKSGIYKKASELAILTGAEVGVLIFSPTQKPYTFAYPSMEAIANRFSGQNLPPENEHLQPYIDIQRNGRIDGLTSYYSELVRQLEAEKDREKELTESVVNKEHQDWWEAPLNQMSMEELQHMDNHLKVVQEELRVKLIHKGLLPPSTSSSPSPSQNP